jgi:hypothetical protein
MNRQIIFLFLATLKPHHSVRLARRNLFPQFFPLILTFLFSTMFAQLSHSAEVTLMWDQNDPMSVTGYYVYYGLESGSYTTKIDAGYDSQYTLFDLDDLTSYYIAVTAYNEFGESDYSEEIIYPSHACEGDFDRDGNIDGTDLANSVADFGRTNCLDTGDCAGDMDSDGDVDETDLAKFALDFGRTDCLW